MISIEYRYYTIGNLRASTSRAGVRLPVEAACYNASMLPDLQMNDVLRLRKPHPCGGYEWKVVRLGADIGLECLRCGRRVLLPRRELARRLKKVVEKAGDVDHAIE